MFGKKTRLKALATRTARTVNGKGAGKRARKLKTRER
jgi:hypothetical protein